MATTITMTGQDKELLATVVRQFPYGQVPAERAQFLIDNQEVVGLLLLRGLTSQQGPDPVVGLTDEEAVHFLMKRPKKPLSKQAAEATVKDWRAYATARGYFGPVAWLVRPGFTLKVHAPAFGPCNGDLQYLQDWQLKNDEPTRLSLAFWVPILAEGSTGKNVREMESLRDKLRNTQHLPEGHCNCFGSIALLFGLILAHYKRMDERVPASCFYAASDTLHVNGGRLFAGGFGADGLYCNCWAGDCRDDDIGFFLLGVEALGQ